MICSQNNGKIIIVICTIRYKFSLIVDGLERISISASILDGRVCCRFGLAVVGADTAPLTWSTPVRRLNLIFTKRQCHEIFLLRAASAINHPSP